MLPERKRKAAKKRGYDVRTDSRLRHNNSTRSIPAHIRSYDNNGRGCTTLEHGAATKDPITGYTLHRDQKRS